MCILLQTWSCCTLADYSVSGTLYALQHQKIHLPLCSNIHFIVAIWNLTRSISRVRLSSVCWLVWNGRPLNHGHKAQDSLCCQQLRFQHMFCQTRHNMVVLIQNGYVLQGHSKFHVLPHGFLVQCLQSLALRKVFSPLIPKPKNFFLSVKVGSMAPSFSKFPSIYEMCWRCVAGPVHVPRPRFCSTSPSHHFTSKKTVSFCIPAAPGLREIPVPSVF